MFHGTKLVKEELAQKFPRWASGVRGRGLLLGLVLSEEGISRGADVVGRMFAKGAIINFAGNRVLRFAPPLIVSTNEIDTLIQMLNEVLTELT